MNQYIALLRGINVGGKRKILMADLRQMLSDRGFLNVITYIQSGNIIFSIDKAATIPELEEQLCLLIKEKYGFDVPVIIRTHKELVHIVENNPFLMDDTNIESLYMVFLKTNPADTALQKIAAYDYPPDKFQIINNNIFLFFAGYSRDSKLSIQFFESKLKVSASARNWKTVLKLIELSK